jgi:RNA polymerase sigma-70 factor, ECF subfamily
MTDSGSPSLEQEFEKAYNDYSDAIFRHCYFRVFDRERGKDLMQETFMRTWTFLSEGKKVDNMRAFLYRVANNLIVDHVRKKKEASLDAMQEAGWDPGYDQTEDMQKRIEQRNIMETLHTMDEGYREVLVMRYVDGLPPADIADILGESANTVSVRLHRGIKQLRAHLQKGGKGGPPASVI